MLCRKFGCEKLFFENPHLPIKTAGYYHYFSFTLNQFISIKPSTPSPVPLPSLVHAGDVGPLQELLQEGEREQRLGEHRLPVRHVTSRIRKKTWGGRKGYEYNSYEIYCTSIMNCDYPPISNYISVTFLGRWGYRLDYSTYGEFGGIREQPRSIVLQQLLCPF